MISRSSQMFRTRSLALLAFLAFTFCHNLIAGELDPQQAKWHDRYQKQANAPEPAEMLLNHDPEPDLTEGFVPLFNGNDLQGWEVKGGSCQFKAEDQHIVGTCIPGSNSTYLCTTDSDFKDFVFTCDVKWLVEGNSGVMFRARSKPSKQDHEVVYGPQAEMEEYSNDRNWSGGIYGQSCGGFFYPLWLKEHKAARAAMQREAWNRLTISAQGNVIKTWINGVPTTHWVDDGSYPSGFFGLQIHQGKQGTVLWKNIRVKRVEADTQPSEDG